MHNKSENLLGQDESFYEAEIQQEFDDLHEFNIIHNERSTQQGFRLTWQSMKVAKMDSSN